MMKTLNLILLAMLLPSLCCAEDKADPQSRRDAVARQITEQLPVVTTEDLVKQLELHDERRKRGEVARLYSRVGTNRVVFPISEAQLSTNTNSPPRDTINASLLLAKSKAEILRLFPGSSGWQFESLTLERMDNAEIRFRKQQSLRKIAEAHAGLGGEPSEVSDPLSEMWFYKMEWSRTLETEAQSISIPVLLTGEVVKGVIEGLQQRGPLDF